MTVANVIRNFGRPTLVLSHNKTLAAQLYGELKSFFPHNAVEYFISYYDYYQPEAYVPTTDTYIEKDASINEDIDRLRLRATSSLMERDDVVIVATVSAIYGLGDPRSYREQMVTLTKGQRVPRDDILRSLVKIQYSRNDMGLERGTFRVRGDTVEILPAYEEQGVRVEMWGDEIERVSKINPLTGDTIANLEKAAIYPAKHFVTSRPTIERAVGLIREELAQRLSELRQSGKLLEAQRLESRTNFDIEMMLEIGTCAGIENYSRHLSGRAEGERPACLFDYFPEDFLVVVDESHVTLPQIGGMFNGDRARKLTLVDYGFRLPSALDNRPLMFDEFLSLTPRALNITATPGDIELRLSEGAIVEQIIRPTGSRRSGDRSPSGARAGGRSAERDPPSRAKGRARSRHDSHQANGGGSRRLSPADGRARSLHARRHRRDRAHGDRPRAAARRVRRAHRNQPAAGRTRPAGSLARRDSRRRPGRIPAQRSLADSDRRRAARHLSGRAIFYADRMTGSMERAIGETGRRREMQRAYNTEAWNRSNNRSHEEHRAGPVHHARGGRSRGERSTRRGSHSPRCGIAPRVRCKGQRAPHRAWKGNEGAAAATSISRPPRGCATSCSRSRPRPTAPGRVREVRWREFRREVVHAHRHVVPPLAERSRLVLDEEEPEGVGTRASEERSAPPLVITLTGKRAPGRRASPRPFATGTESKSR